MKDIGTKTIETNRLILRRVTISDVDGMYDGWASDENVTKYVSWKAHRDKNETLAIIISWIQEYERNSYNWVVEVKESQKLHFWKK